MRKRIVVAITGASGAVYGVRLLRALFAQPVTVHLIISDAGKKVMAHELGYDGEDIPSFLARQGIDTGKIAHLRWHDNEDFFAPPASGSFHHQGMVITPCSMHTLAAVATGIADNLILRAADVCLKEKRPLILMPRETPLSRVHLKNLLAASEAGATIMPACPGFYHHPASVEELIDAVVARVLDHLGIAQNLSKEWGKS